MRVSSQGERGAAAAALASNKRLKPAARRILNDDLFFRCRSLSAVR